MNLIKDGHRKSYIFGNLKAHESRQIRSNRKILLKDTKVNTATYGKLYHRHEIIYWNSLSEDLYKKLNLF